MSRTSESRPPEPPAPQKAHPTSRSASAEGQDGTDPLLTIDETLEKVDVRLRQLKLKLGALKTLHDALLDGQPTERFDQEDLTWVISEMQPIQREIECWEFFGGNLRAERIGMDQKLAPIEESMRDRYERLQRLDAETHVFGLFPDLRKKFLEKQRSLLGIIYRQKVGGRFRWKELESAVVERVRCPEGSVETASSPRVVSSSKDQQRSTGKGAIA